MQLTVREAALLLDASEAAIYDWIDANEIPFQRVDDQYRFNRAELVEWATLRGMRVSVDAVQTRRGPSSPPVYTLSDALEAGGVHPAIPAVDGPSVIRGIVARLQIERDEDREALAAVLIAREAMRSTVGDGIAIPHVHSPVVVQGAHAAVALCYLERPLDFGAHDGQPVSTVFMLTSPNAKAHLQLLSRLSSALHAPDFRAAVLGRASLPEVLAAARRFEENFRR